jgi:hypothetical protein
MICNNFSLHNFPNNLGFLRLGTFGIPYTHIIGLDWIGLESVNYIVKLMYLMGVRERILLLQ